MGDRIYRKYATATTVTFQLYKLDGTGLKIDAASATHDIKIMKDEGAEADTTADAFVDEGQGYSLALTATELTAARIVIYIVDLSSPQVWLDKTLNIETYGDPSAQHADGAVSASIGTITNSGGTATLGAVLGDMANSAVVTRLGNAQTELNKIGTIANTGGTATIGAVLGDPANSSVATRLNTNLNATVSSRSSHSAADVWTVATRNVTAQAFPFTNPAAPLDLTNIQVDGLTKAPSGTKTWGTGTALTVNDILNEALTGHTTADSLGLAIKNCLKVSKNKWAIVGSQLIYYDDNGSTALYTFNLDSATAPTSRTPV